jgi:hypothetical protein
MDWGAIGVGIFGRYAAVWLGDGADPESQASEIPGRRLANR